MNLLSLNLNGFGEGDYKKGWVNDMVVSHKVDFLGIQETKRKKISEKLARAVWGSFDYDFIYQEGRGRGGGLLSMWNKNVFDLETSRKRRDVIITSGKWISTNKPICFINVYAGQSRAEKRELWKYISDYLNDWTGESVVFGDFNAVRHPEERMGSYFDKSETEEFNKFILDNSLLDVPLGGKRFTWANRSGSKLSRLDRVFTSLDFDNSWPNTYLSAETKLHSDHVPLIFKEQRIDYRATPFRFLNSWLKDKEYEELVHRWWNEFSITGEHNLLFVFLKKLKFIKDKTKEWFAKKRVDKDEDKKKVLDDIKAIEDRFDEGVATIEDANRKTEYIRKLFDIKSAEHKDVGQKFKNKWGLEGDENSALFHKYVNKKKREKNIKGVMEEGLWFQDPEEVKDKFFNHFQSRFEAESGDVWYQDFEGLNTLSREQRKMLEGDFSDVEIKGAVWDVGLEKSPGPDGFTVEFVKFFWSLISKELISAIQAFGRDPYIPHGMNSAFIALIPKIPNTLSVADFRPISLVGIVYKILAKILANRLKKVLGNIIGAEQSAFVEKRQILDGPLIINEVVGWAKAKRKKIMMFKTDIEKAYDSVKWSYLYSIMVKMGFGGRWRGWIMSILRSGFSSVLVNGSPTKEFKLGRGLRQGDPLSPFLFTLIMEGLNLAMKKAIDNQVFKGVRIGDNDFLLSHLFFADDAVFLGEWNWENIQNLKHILSCLQKVAGLKVNLAKSSLFGIGVNQPLVEGVAAALGCQRGKLPTVFLGIPIGQQMHICKSWDTLIQKFKKRLAKWKCKALSIGGRATLVKSVLGSIGSYWFSLFRVPKGVCDMMEKLRKDFFWGSDENKMAIPWVKWDMVCSRMEKGGLDIGSLHNANLALIAKWVWRFKNEPKAIWVQIISSIHGKNGLMDRVVWERSRSSLWKNMMSTIHEDKIELDLSKHFRSKVGDGKNTLFWFDIWLEDSSMKDRFPNLFQLETEKDITVEKAFGRYGGIKGWLDRLGTGRSGAAWREMVSLLSNVELSNNTDSVYCLEAPNSCFSVSWCRGKIDGVTQKLEGRATRWNKWIPRKVNIFLWRMRRQRLPTRDKLERMGMILPTTLCPMCQIKEETILHLFCECTFASNLWDSLCSWWKTPFTFKGGIEDLETWGSDSGLKGRRLKCFKTVVEAICWEIWDSRNNIVFRDGVLSLEASIRRYKDLSLFWLSSRASKIGLDSKGWYAMPNISCN